MNLNIGNPKCLEYDKHVVLYWSYTSYMYQIFVLFLSKSNNRLKTQIVWDSSTCISRYYFFLHHSGLMPLKMSHRGERRPQWLLFCDWTNSFGRWYQEQVWQWPIWLVNSHHTGVWRLHQRQEGVWRLHQWRECVWRHHRLHWRSEGVWGIHRQWKGEWRLHLWSEGVWRLHRLCVMAPLLL